MSKKDTSGRNPQSKIALLIPLLFYVIPVCAESPAQMTANAPIEGGPVFKVSRYEKRTPSHKDARVVVFRKSYDTPENILAFIEGTGKGKGAGMHCDPAIKGPDFLLCTRALQDKAMIEVLMVANIGSDFCDDLRNTLDNKDEYKTPDGKNPVMKDNECQDVSPKTGKCICYRIDHVKFTPTGPVIDVVDPPGNGSGSGGHD